MHELMDELYELCETVEADLKKTNEKLRMAGGNMTGADLEYVDKLTHTLKSIKCVIAMLEEDDGYSERDGSSTEGGSSYRQGGGSSYRQGGGSSYRQGGGSSYRRGGGSSYRRGGSSYAQRRNRMGQFTRGGEDEFREMLEEAMENAPNDQLRMQIEQVMNQM